MTNKQFLKIIKQDAKIVKKWPKWRQEYVINSDNASTGNFFKKQT